MPARIWTTIRQDRATRRRLLAGALACAGLAWYVGLASTSGRQATPEALALGREMFLREWQVSGRESQDPLVQRGGDGLGPVFNARSCVTCHSQGGVGGAGSNKQNVLAFDVVPTRADPRFHKGIIHAAACSEGSRDCPTEVNTRFPFVKGEQRRVGGCVVTLPDFNPVAFTRINAPSLFGMGPIDSISGSAIRSNQRQRKLAIYPRELRGDFGSTPAGRVRILKDGRVGKFGWKAQFADLKEFVANACAVELGLSNPLRRQDRPHLNGEDSEAPLDLSEQQLLALTAYTAEFPAPARTLPADPAEQEACAQGERLFTTIGCADCHTPGLDGVAGVYSDFLLHKLEDDRDFGAYGRVNPDLPPPDDEPFPNEWKTAPLWGVADSAPYFHDGGSPTLEAAILRHGVHARHVTERYKSLPLAEQRAIIRFLETLRAPRNAEPAPRQEEIVASANSH